MKRRKGGSSASAIWSSLSRLSSTRMADSAVADMGSASVMSAGALSKRIKKFNATTRLIGYSHTQVSDEEWVVEINGEYMSASSTVRGWLP
jgi:hypothetical protein